MILPLKTTVNIVAERVMIHGKIIGQRNVYMSFVTDRYGNDRCLIHTGKISIYPGLYRAGAYVLKPEHFN